MGADEAKTFASEMRAKIMGASKPTPTKKPGAAKAPATVPADDDDGLPF
jgi:hypothetical protein